MPGTTFWPEGAEPNVQPTVGDRVRVEVSIREQERGQIGRN